MIVIKLTVMQSDLAAWAIDPMEDYFRGLVDEGEMEAVPSLPSIDGRLLLIPEVKAVIEDLLYRLEEQLPDMQEQAAESPGIVRSAESLAGKIRAAAEAWL